MTTLFRSIVIGGMLTFSGLFVSVQQLPQNIVISIAPGDYEPEYLIRMIENQNISISYSQSALTGKKIRIGKDNYRLSNLLPLIFDLSSYSYILRDSKILIVPKPSASLNKTSGSLIRPNRNKTLMAMHYKSSKYLMHA